MNLLPLVKLTPWLDRYAISTSALCAIHCLCLPLLLILFPVLSSTFFGQESFHVMLLWFVIPLSLASLSLGCSRHRSRLVAFLGLSGLGLLIMAAAVGHDFLGEVGERAVTLAGAIVIATSHLRNFRLCRQYQCDHSTHN